MEKNNGKWAPDALKFVPVDPDKIEFANRPKGFEEGKKEENKGGN